MDKLADGADGGGINPAPAATPEPARRLARIPAKGGELPRRRGDVAGLLHTISIPEYHGVTAARRQLLADFCRFIGKQLHSLNRGHSRSMAPRLRQTLSMLLEGDAEKEIARKLGISKHTVHVYIKALHKHFDVSSRSELMALFIRRFAGATPTVL